MAAIIMVVGLFLYVEYMANSVEEDIGSDMAEIKRLELYEMEKEDPYKFPNTNPIKVIDDKVSIESFTSIWDELGTKSIENLNLYTDEIVFDDFEKMYYVLAGGDSTWKEDEEVDYKESIYLLAVFLDDKDGNSYINFWNSDSTYVLKEEKAELFKNILGYEGN